MMRVAGPMRIALLGLWLYLPLSGAIAQTSQSSVQGAWLASGPACEDVFSSGGKGTSFKKPVDVFAPAFIISSNRLRTPTATCRIKSSQQAGERRLLTLDCSNAVSGSQVKVLMSITPDGALRRYFNEHDNIGTEYKRCSQ